MKEGIAAVQVGGKSGEETEVQLEGEAECGSEVGQGRGRHRGERCHDILHQGVDPGAGQECSPALPHARGEAGVQPGRQLQGVLHALRLGVGPGRRRGGKGRMPRQVEE